MNEHPFQAFIDLISFDQKTIETENLVDTLEAEIKRYKKEIDLFSQELSTLKDTVYDLRKEVDGQELHMKEYDAQEQRLKKRLEEITNQKEYQSVRKEIDTLKKQQFGYEEIILETWNKLENAQRDYEEKNKQSASK